MIAPVPVHCFSITFVYSAVFAISCLGLCCRTGSSLADVLNNRDVPGRYKKAEKYLLRIFVMSQLALQSLSCLFQT